MNSNILDWGVAGRHMAGETLSGDLHLVKPFENNILIAVADGLGHGKAAAEASRLALDTVDEYSHKPLVQIVEHCSRRLRATRGATMSLAVINAIDGSMEWLGVGNVEAVLLRSTPNGKPARESLLPSRGIVGGSMPPLRTSAVKVGRGDTLVFATDGIRPGFEDGMVLLERPGETAKSILARDGLETDDALVLVATYQGRAR